MYLSYSSPNAARSYLALEMSFASSLPGPPSGWAGLRSVIINTYGFLPFRVSSPGGLPFLRSGPLLLPDLLEHRGQVLKMQVRRQYIQQNPAFSALFDRDLA